MCMQLSRGAGVISLRRLLTLMSLLVLLVAVALPNWAKPVDAGTARQAATAWLAGNPTIMHGHAVKAQRAFTDEQGQTIAYILALQPKGFLVVPADDEIEPILAYSTESDFAGDQRAESVWNDLLRGDIPARLAHPEKTTKKFKDSVAISWGQLKKANAAEEFDSATASGKIGTTAVTVTTVVDPLITDTWDQCNSVLLPSGTSVPGYNYYTPNHYYTGCIATTMGMLLHYYQYPSQATATGPIYVDGVQRTASFNDAFDYSLMPAKLTSTSSLSEVQEVAKLLNDCGIAINMSYTSSSSSASSASIPTVLTKTFGYLSATFKYGTDADWASVLQNELKTAHPVPLSIGSTTLGSGHSLLCDGLGTSGATDMYHLNFGWSGSYNGWYSVPSMYTGSICWDTLKGLIVNIRVPSSTPSASPVAQNDSYTATAGASVCTVVAKGVLQNDTNTTGKALTAVAVGKPGHGALTLNGDGGFSYSPVKGFAGTDSFTYQASDGATLSNLATVSIIVPPVPFAVNNDQAQTTANTPVTINVLDNDTGVTGTPPIIAVTQGLGGMVTLNPDSTITYTPSVGLTCGDSFTYTAQDATGSTATATVSVIVYPILSGVSLQTSAASPQFVNTPITLMAVAAGGGNIEYQFLLGTQVRNTWSWTTLQGYSTSSTCVWKPGKAANYILKVYARKVGNTTAWDVQAQTTFTISAIASSRKK